jgi:hypothetical protein
MHAPGLNMSVPPPNYIIPQQQQYYQAHRQVPVFTDGSQMYNQTEESYHLMMQAITSPQGQALMDVNSYTQQQEQLHASGGDYVQAGIQRIPVDSQMQAQHRQADGQLSHTKQRLPTVPQQVDSTSQQLKAYPVHGEQNQGKVRSVRGEQNQGKLHVHGESPPHQAKPHCTGDGPHQQPRSLPRNSSNTSDRSHSREWSSSLTSTGKSTSFQNASSQEVKSSNPETVFDEGAWLEDESETVDVSKASQTSSRPRPIHTGKKHK